MTEEQPAGVFANREIAAFAGFILRSLDRLVACLAQVDADGLNWRPPASQANSLAVLALHTLGNAEENLVDTLGGQPISRQRDREFPDQAVTLDAVMTRWQGLRPRLLAVFQRLTPADLEREIRHPRRGPLVGREVLVVVARHAAEHLGQAELTRDLYLASRADDHASLHRADVAAARTALFRKLRGYQVTQAIAVATELGIADRLIDGPRSIDDLAQATGTHPPSLFRLLRFLAGEGLFAEVEPGRFELTAEADLLRSDVAGSVRASAITHGADWRWRAWGRLSDSIRTGRPAFDQVFEMGFYDYLASRPEQAATFNAAMAGGTDPMATAIGAAYDLSTLGTVVDVGGGTGALLIGLLRARPSLRGILLDSAATVAEARERLAVAGLSDRCTVVAGDFFTAVPPGGDLYLLKHVIHDWDDVRASALLRACRRAMAPGARLVLIEMLVPSGNEPSYSKSSDLHLLVVLGGRERTVEEYRVLLADADLALAQVIPAGGDLHLIEAIPR